MGRKDCEKIKAQGPENLRRIVGPVRVQGKFRNICNKALRKYSITICMTKKRPRSDGSPEISIPTQFPKDLSLSYYKDRQDQVKIDLTVLCIIDVFGNLVRSTASRVSQRSTLESKHSGHEKMPIRIETACSIAGLNIKNRVSFLIYVVILFSL